MSSASASASASSAPAAGAAAGASMWERLSAASVATTAASDAVFSVNAERVAEQRRTKPWRADPKYFKKVKLSSLAMTKMVLHATSGGDLEVMGMLQGYVDGETFVVLDSFALPVQGTETRVNAQAESMEYLVQYTTLLESTGRDSGCVGWYHSHPGYGCWLSGIDVTTQSQHQRVQDPWLAVVVDPKRTMASGKVEVGAFRTYPDGYVPEGTSSVDIANLPASKVEDFGVYVNKYYQLDVSFFKSSVDTQLLNLMWSKYWANTLSASPVVTNRDYAIDTVGNVVRQLGDVEQQLQHASRHGGASLSGGGAGGKAGATTMEKVQRDVVKITNESLLALTNQVVKDVLFNSARRGITPGAPSM